MVTVEYISNQKIAESAGDFLKKHHPSLKFPIPIEKIAEFSLGMSVLPVKDLKKVFGHESFISGDFKIITIDEGQFNSFEEWTRFTITHEIGHSILHKKIYTGENIKNIDNFLTFVNSIGEKNWSRMEIQANIFAHSVLIPQEALEKLIDREMKSVGGIDSFEYGHLISLVDKMQKKFFVSQSCASNKLRNYHPELIAKVRDSVPF